MQQIGIYEKQKHKCNYGWPLGGAGTWSHCPSLAGSATCGQAFITDMFRKLAELQRYTYISEPVSTRPSDVTCARFILLLDLTRKCSAGGRCYRHPHGQEDRDSNVQTIYTRCSTNTFIVSCFCASLSCCCCCCMLLAPSVSVIG